MLGDVEAAYKDLVANYDDYAKARISKISLSACIQDDAELIRKSMFAMDMFEAALAWQADSRRPSLRQRWPPFMGG